MLCYVIDFHLTHLSGGNYLSQAFADAQEIFYEKWFHVFGFCYVRTLTGAIMCLSKYKILRLIGSSPRIAQFFIIFDWIHPYICPR